MNWLKSKWWKRIVLFVLGVVLASIGYGLLQLIEPVAIAPVAECKVLRRKTTEPACTSSTQPLQFTGRGLLVASDADMVATAYADAKLDRVRGIEDTLTAIALPLNPEQPVVSPIQVSNSVMSWPQIIAISPDSQRAYVAEVRSRPADGIQEFQDIEEMPDGERITIVDIANIQQPKVVQTVSVGRNPKHISLSPDGNFLAVNLEEEGKELTIFPIQPDGTLGERSDFAIAKDFPSSIVTESVTWHTSGKFLALTTTTSSDTEGEFISFVAFYKVLSDSSKIQIEPYGSPIQVGNHLSMGRFTPDGRWFLVPDLKWRIYGTSLPSFLMNPKGELIAISLNEQSSQPEIVSRAEVGLSPEGFAISPDSTIAVTVNMRRTYLPNWLPAWRGRDRNSLSLVKIDRDSGQLMTVGEYGFEGLLPEQATFDADGKSLAVVIYNDRIPAPKTGRVEFWQVISGENPRLERTGFKLDVVRGAHDIVLVP